ncbi:MAG: hypothetical protein V8T51_00680 [Senegalimassilia faecalis]
MVQQMDNLERRYGGNQPEGIRFAVSSHHFTFAERAFLDVMQQVDAGRYDLMLNETQTSQIDRRCSELRKRHGRDVSVAFERRRSGASA